MPKFRCNKLGRDKGAEGFKSQNVVAQYRLLKGQELQLALKNKMIEEALEVQEAQDLNELTSELADILEVVDGLCKAYGIDKRELVKVKEQKFNERGGFEKGFYLETVKMSEENPRIKHFRERPDKYPEE